MAQARDLRQIRRARTPNDTLAAPAGITLARPDFAVPSYPLSAEELCAALRAVAVAEPRTEEVTAAGAPPERLVFAARSRLFGFEDRIEAQVVEMPDGLSLILYSRALTGLLDLGVNRRRVKRWLAALNRAP